MLQLSGYIEPANVQLSAPVFAHAKLKGSMLLYLSDQSAAKASRSSVESCASTLSPSYIDIRNLKEGP